MRGGFMLDDNTYVSNGIDMPWLIFRGNTTVKLWFPPEVAGRQAELPVVGVGVDETPNSPQSQEEGANYTTGIGQLALFNDLNTTPTSADGGECVPNAGGDGGLDGGSACIPLYGGSVEITNSSCASYFLYAEIHFALPEVAPVESPSIGSGGLDAGSSMAGVGIDVGAGTAVDSGGSPLAQASAGDAGNAGSD
jgi:hypothetical protein